MSSYIQRLALKAGGSQLPHGRISLSESQLLNLEKLIVNETINGCSLKLVEDKVILQTKKQVTFPDPGERVGAFNAVDTHISIDISGSKLGKQNKVKF